MIEVEGICVDGGAGAAVTAVDEAAVELDEGAEVRGEVQVGAEQVALEEVAVVGWLRAEGWVVLVFAALAELAVDG